MVFLFLFVNQLTYSLLYDSLVNLYKRDEVHYYITLKPTLLEKISTRVGMD